MRVAARAAPRGTHEASARRTNIHRRRVRARVVWVSGVEKKTYTPPWLQNPAQIDLKLSGKGALEML